MLKATQSKRDKDPGLLALNPANKLWMRTNRQGKSSALLRLFSEEWWLGGCLVIYCPSNPWLHLQYQMKNKTAEL